ncbi:MAG: response regulator transcription factor [Gammaproteobacteria bacterium]|nr:response regulator transcription factor [Gammaproteobacteria bacterium]MDE1886887.1 response regulator transcription factor [Gammaproteobacteria bacterium]MDE2023385.1 response regulator transcription factor [Gammaproteobacteria bacterium]MDE2069944.1 response regulator transcription factor [Gammaproteobacteria bacterium]MDE2272759.1 response regulator transcription factor [Gammaproteobacteria bacterium]
MRVILIDDNVLFLETLGAELAHNPAVEVVGRATGGVEGLKLARELEPDVVISDLAMPCMNGLDLTHSLKRLPSPPRVVMMSMFDEPEYREGALLVGVDAYIAKHDVHSELLPLLRRLNEEIAPRNAAAAGMRTAHAPG